MLQPVEAAEFIYDGNTWTCRTCRRSFNVPASLRTMPVMQCDCHASPADLQTAAPQFGPGSELRKLLSSLGVHSTGDCGCESMVARMNAWGSTGCRDRFDSIVQHMVDAARNRTTLVSLSPASLTRAVAKRLLERAIAITERSGSD